MTKRLILGEGPKSKHEDDKIRIDIVPEWADIVCDLNTNDVFDIEGSSFGKFIYKYPELHNNKFNYIEAHHIFEHIESGRQLVKIMNWLHDVLEEGGKLDITVPHWKSDSAVECIEHVRFFNENSFMNYYDNPYAKEMKIPQFKKIINELRPHGGHIEVHVALTR